MKRELFDIWEDLYSPLEYAHWQVQLPKAIGNFRTREDAERFVEKTRAFREAEKKSVK